MNLVELLDLHQKIIMKKYKEHQPREDSFRHLLNNYHNQKIEVARN